MSEITDPSEKLYAAHKPIRNRLRRYKRTETLMMVMSALLKNEGDLRTCNGYIPWECMLLIRWILEYSDDGPNKIRPDENLIKRCINEIKHLYDQGFDTKNLSEHGINKFMRRLAFQQFSYQLPHADVGLKAGRQLVMFVDLGKSYHVDEKFFESTGVSIQDFIKISFSVFSMLPDGVYAFQRDDLVRVFPSEVVDNYLKLVALTPTEAGKFLRSDTERKGRRFVLQLYEVSPLAIKPFLILEGRVFLYSKRLFRYFFANFIYDFLCSHSDRFQDFGEILEKYMAGRLNASGYDFRRDRQWRSLFGIDVSAPDFTVLDKDCIIFIEAKRKDLPLIPKVLQTNYSFSKNLDDSIIKGVLQIYNLAHELTLRDSELLTTREEMFGVVVSYRDHFLRGGQQFWDEFLSEEIPGELRARGISLDLIPVENLFLISVDEFDDLLDFLKRNPSQSFRSVFTSIKMAERDPARSSFFFSDHLRNLGGEKPYPEHLWNRMKQVIDETIDLVQKLERNRIPHKVEAR